MSIYRLLLLGAVHCVLAGTPHILIVYYSRDGHTQQMAQAVEKGALSVDSVRVTLGRTDQITPNMLLDADAIILGSPVYNASAAPEIQRFINQWPFNGQPLKNKIGAAFVTGGGISAGQEFVLMQLIRSMMMFNMIIVGGENWQSAFGAAAVTGEEPFHGPEVNKMFLEKGKALGRRVALLTLKWKKIARFLQQ